MWCVIRFALCFLTLSITIIADNDNLEKPDKGGRGVVNYNHEGPRMFKSIAMTCKNITDKINGHEFQTMYGMFLLPLVKAAKSKPLLLLLLMFRKQ